MDRYYDGILPLFRQKLTIIDPKLILITLQDVGRDNSFGTATEIRAGRSGTESRWGRDFSAPPDLPWGPPSLL